MRPAPGQMNLFAGQGSARQQYEDADVPLNSSVPPHEAPRLGPQHAVILARLREGPATNVELGRIAQRFTARLNELRRAGVAWDKRCLRPGVYEYRLIGDDAAE